MGDGLTETERDVVEERLHLIGDEDAHVSIDEFIEDLQDGDFDE